MARRRRTLPRLPMPVTACVIFGAVVAVAIAERRSPLRRRREPELQHVARDMAMAGLSTAATTAMQSALLRPLMRRLESGRIGLVGSGRLNAPLRLLSAVLLLDYTLWIWHWLNHRMPLLWRFHRVHHVDLDLDAATGARFHFGEMALSTLFRWLQLRLIGPDPLAVSLWQTMLLASILFHHSNVRLSTETDDALAHIIVTPRMHGIHHSIAQRETNSNFASLFTIWDMLHRSFQIDVPQETITIGVPAYQAPGDVTIGRILALPLRDTQGDWVSPGPPAPQNPGAPSPARR